IALPFATALKCWSCINAKSNEECRAVGREIECNEINAICYEEVRHYRYGTALLIEKRYLQHWHAPRKHYVMEPYPVRTVESLSRIAFSSASPTTKSTPPVLLATLVNEEASGHNQHLAAHGHAPHLPSWTL
uniref:Uncharacterized protein n=1 Tax=Ciona savignyi TaxID=51511 RepID=H2YP78_CIOSA